MTNLYEVPRGTAATVTASGAAPAGQHQPVDASSGNITLTLPTGVNVGASLAVEKVDSSSNTVTVSGTIRGTSGTVVLGYQYEVVELIAETSSSWRVESNHLPKAAVDAKIATQAAADSATYSTQDDAAGLALLAGLGVFG